MACVYYNRFPAQIQYGDCRFAGLLSAAGCARSRPLAQAGEMRYNKSDRKERERICHVDCNQAIRTKGRGSGCRHLERGRRGGRRLPQTELLDEESGHAFFSGQSFTGLAYDTATGGLVGLYILHPNNVGRCGHICNASYAVKSGLRGQHIGEALVRHCMEQAKKLGFGILQFNAVVKTNLPALRLYKKLGFVQLGVIPGGFRMKDGTYEDIIPHYHIL